MQAWWFVHNSWAAAQRFFDAGRASKPRVRRHLVHSARAGLNTGPGWQNALSLSENPLYFVFKSLAGSRRPLRSIAAAQSRVR